MEMIYDMFETFAIIVLGLVGLVQNWRIGKLESKKCG